MARYADGYSDFLTWLFGDTARGLLAASKIRTRTEAAEMQAELLALLSDDCNCSLSDVNAVLEKVEYLEESWQLE